MEKAELRVSITAIVVNYNAGALLGECVRALRSSDANVEVMVLDNDSTDRSAENLRNLYGTSPGLEIAFNPSNVGFARAVNACARRIKTQYLLVINPDCRVATDTVTQLRAALDDDERAALAGPAVVDSGGKLERAALRRFPDPWKSLVTVTGLWRLGKWFSFFRGVPVNAINVPVETERVDAVSGACMLVRRDALEQVGYMDECYTMHCEDLDLMYRLRQAGWHCLFVPMARAVHVKGVSSASRPLWVHRQKHLSMVRFFQKFQAREHSLPVRWLVYAGIWARYTLLWPLVLLRR